MFCKLSKLYSVVEQSPYYNIEVYGTAFKTRTIYSDNIYIMYDACVSGQTLTFITGWAVALTCCISHIVKYRKKADFDHSGSQNRLTNFDETWHG